MRVIQLGSRDRGVESAHGGRRAVHDGGAGVDDGADVGDDSLAVDDGLGAGGLPETGVLDRVEFDGAGVEVFVSAAEVKRRAGRGELECKAVLGHGTLGERVLEESWLRRGYI